MNFPGRTQKFLGLISLLITILFYGCGGRAVNRSQARDIILKARADTLAKGDLQVLGVTQVGSQEAVVETQLHSAFRLQKVDGAWLVREIKVGQGQWEKFGDLVRALERIKIENTRSSLEQIAAAMGAYRTKNDRLPFFRNFIELSDALYPLYMSPLIREDAWNHPLIAVFSPPGTVRLISPGPDGKVGTPDDIEIVSVY
jgi:hypothetical protein